MGKVIIKVYDTTGRPANTVYANDRPVFEGSFINSRSLERELRRFEWNYTIIFYLESCEPNKAVTKIAALNYLKNKVSGS